MGIRLSSLTSVMVIAAVTGFSSAAKADPYPSSLGLPYNYGSVGLAEEFERVFFRNDRESFNNRSIPRQLDYIFGIRDSFPENEMNRDAKAVHRLYVETFKQQVSSDPIIRTPDLPNPYCTSLLQSGAFNTCPAPVRGREFIYEEQPPR